MADTIAIVVIVVINAVIGFVQEYRAEKAMSVEDDGGANGHCYEGWSHFKHTFFDVVPGDVVLLEAGRISPADLRITE